MTSKNDRIRTTVRANDKLRQEVEALIKELCYFAAFPHIDHTRRLRQAAELLTKLKVYIP